MTVEILADPQVRGAIDRLVDIARSDTGQSARVANFLLAWWNGDDWGHFPISDLFGVDRAIATDMATIFAFLGQYPGAIYVHAFGEQYRDPNCHRWQREHRHQRPDHEKR